MTTNQQFEQILLEAAPICDEVAAVERHPDGFWAITLEHGNGIHVHRSEETQRVTFVIQVVDLPEPLEPRQYETLLVYNNAWHETEGTRFSLSGPGGTLLLIFDTDTGPIEVTSVSRIISSLSQKAHSARKLVEAMSHVNRTDSSTTNPNMTNAIRV